MLPEMQDLHLWVRPEIFELGVLPIVIPEKISVEMLSKLLHHARELGERGYPTMTYETWNHLAIRKMGLSQECCEVMFLNCQLFSQQLPPQQDEDTVTWDSVVWTLELITMLYIQRVTSAHPRVLARQTSLHLLTNDPWPATVTSNNGAPVAVTSGAAVNGCGVSNNHASSSFPGLVKKKLPEEYHLKFIKDSLSELLSLLAGHVSVEDSESRAQKRRSGDWKSFKDVLGSMRGMGVVGVEVVRALDILIGVTAPNTSGVKLLDAAIDKSFSYQSGYLSKKNTFQKGLFEQWVLGRLDWSPHGEWLCTRRGQRLHWPVVAASPHHRLHCHPHLPAPARERLVCISDMIEGITVHLGDAATNTTPKKPARQPDLGSSSPNIPADPSASVAVNRDQTHPSTGLMLAKDVAGREILIPDSVNLRRKLEVNAGLSENLDVNITDVEAHKVPEENCPNSSTAPKNVNNNSQDSALNNLDADYRRAHNGIDVALCDNFISTNSGTKGASHAPLNRSLSAPSSEAFSDSPPALPRRSLSLTDVSRPALLDVKIRRCTKSQIYILQPLRHVLLHRLHDTKVVLGPVQGRLRLQECRNVTVVAPARSVVISECRSVALCTLTPHRPLLLEGSSSSGLSSVTGHQSVTLGPLNLHYPKLMLHLSLARLRAHDNKWNLPLRLGGDGRCEPSECGLLSPDEFQLQTLPFFPALVDGRPPLLPPGLPNAYCQSVKASQAAVMSVRAEMREACLSPQQRSVLQRAIDQRFKAWLRETGKEIELDLLNKLSDHLRLQVVS
ncbi:TBCC domain-containing protein 1 [Hyalella azteca]|uniref:TBCC domain-containing protein 1 n=1 Tax=Hyalella azteca TaxID=294128 RepID=A0A8B7PAC9_HYAAZ|nr:TBCC domain-containing protein 1 [Hyalella azteca]